jgi:hypothetical protein
VTTPETLSLRIDLPNGSDPIRGRLIASAGEEREFTGWIELVSALQAAWRGDRPADQEGETDGG